MARPTKGTIAEMNAAFLEAAESIVRRAEKSAPPPVKRVAWKASKILCEISLFDHHFGKLAWGAETGHDYDLAIAEALYENAVKDLLDKVKIYRPEEFLFTVGQDLLHVDNVQYQTTQGTPQDCDGRLSKIIETAERATARAIRTLAARGKVRVMWVKGNHDSLMSQMLCRIMAAEFRKDDRVTVDVSPTSRKYVRYGASLLGYTHGNECPIKELPLIMARERPKDWAVCRTREWHTGHLHQQMLIEKMGIKVRILPSLAGTDAWHCDRGYIGNDRAAEAYLYDHSEGYFASFQVQARS